MKIPLKNIPNITQKIKNIFFNLLTKFKQCLVFSVLILSFNLTLAEVDNTNDKVKRFGNGHVRININGIDLKKSSYGIRTIQPLSKLSKNSKRLTFLQGQFSSSKNQNERRSAFNLGIGYRQLLGQGRSIVGINLFTNYEIKSKHKRASIGLEYQKANFTASINQYFPLSDKKIIKGYSEEILTGYNINLATRVPYLPWATIKATQYYWDGINGSSDIKGTVLGVEIQLSSSITLEIGTDKSNDSVKRTNYTRLKTQLSFGKEKFTDFKISKRAFNHSKKISLDSLNFAE